MKPRHLATDLYLAHRFKQQYDKFEIYVVDEHVEYEPLRCAFRPPPPSISVARIADLEAQSSMANEICRV
jgi:hypothetical protein